MDINNKPDGIMKDIIHVYRRNRRATAAGKMQGNGLRAQRINGAQAAGGSRRDAAAQLTTNRTRSGTNMS